MFCKIQKRLYLHIYSLIMGNRTGFVGKDPTREGSRENGGKEDRGYVSSFDKFFHFFFFSRYRAIPATYGSSQARGQIRAAAAGLCHSHSNAGSEPHLQPMTQLT